MSRYIDADKLKDLYQPIDGKEYKISSDILRLNIDDMPTVDVEKVRHGKWGKQVLVEDEFGDRHIGYICPVCKTFVPNRGNYCLECGAKMDGE